MFGARDAVHLLYQVYPHLADAWTHDREAGRVTSRLWRGGIVLKWQTDFGRALLESQKQPDLFRGICMIGER